MSETDTGKESGAQAGEDKEAAHKQQTPEPATGAAAAAAHEKPSLAQVKSAAKKEQIRKVAKAVRSQKVVLPKYQPKQLLMTDLLKQVNEKRASNAAHRAGAAGKTKPSSSSVSAPKRQPSLPDVVVVGSTPVAAAAATTETEETAPAEKPKKESKETEEDEEKRLLWEEKQREWEEEEREMERTVQRFTARVAGAAAATLRAVEQQADDDTDQEDEERPGGARLGGWQKRFREQEERDTERERTRHKSSSSSVSVSITSCGYKRCHSASALVESDELVGDGSYAAHDIDELLAEDTPEASEHFRQQCLRRKRMRDMESASLAALASDSRSFSDEKSQQLLRRIHRTNVATVVAAEPSSSPSLLMLSSQTGDNSLGALPPSSSLTHALQCLKDSAKATDTARAPMFCALPDPTSAEHTPSSPHSTKTATTAARRTTSTPSSSSHKKR